VLAREPDLVPDYVAVADPETLEPVDVARPGTLAMLAARSGRTRLLDNVVLGVSDYGTGLA
jgi:pantothenate synthetase